MMRREGMAAAALLLGSMAVAAQGPGGFGGHGMGMGGPGFGGPGFGPRKVVTGEPYTSVATETSVEKLGDGTTITHASTINEARDSEGRTVVTISSTNGSGTTMSRTTVMDPVAHTVTSWSSGSTVATQFQLPANPPAGHGPWQGPGAGGPPPSHDRVKPQVTRVVLSPTTIAGDSATGVKMTTTIPAGAEGNDKPLVSTREVWTSSDLGIVLLETSESPRQGFHKMEVTSLSPGAPDPSLFQVPSNYTIKTQTRHRGM